MKVNLKEIIKEIKHTVKIFFPRETPFKAVFDLNRFFNMFYSITCVHVLILFIKIIGKNIKHIKIMLIKTLKKMNFRI